MKAITFEKTLALSHSPFLTHHQLNGTPTLPLLCAVSWMAELAEQHYPDYQFSRCETVQALSAIVFNEPLPAQFEVRLVEIKNTAKTGLLLGVTIASAQGDDVPTFHYNGTLRLDKSVSRPNTENSIFEGAEESTDGSVFYQNGTLFQGPLFQSVRELVQFDEKGLTLRCRIDAVNSSDQGQFPVSRLNPYADDALLQALMIWSRKYFDAPYLPFRIPVGEFFQPIPFDTDFWVTLVVLGADSHKVFADITAIDDQGAVFSRLFGLEAYAYPLQFHEIPAKN